MHPRAPAPAIPNVVIASLVHVVAKTIVVCELMLLCKLLEAKDRP